MQILKKVSDQIYYVGADDRRLHLFENMFPLPHGVSYNSYVICDEKTALLDTVDESAVSPFLEKLEAALGGRPLDYLIVHHMEPDHCSGIARVLELYPDCRMVGSAQTFRFFSQFFKKELPAARMIVVKEGDSLSLGQHTLRFLAAPMVHWPEVLLSYETSERILFSADAFGSFGTLDGNLFDCELGINDVLMGEVRRYYTNIVGKYGTQVQAVMKKASALDISLIAPLHGPVWKEEIPRILGKYALWADWTPEDEGGLALFYGSMYGNTKELCEALIAKLSAQGLRGLRAYDVSETEKSYLIAECFRCGYLVFAAPTYNGGLYPKMEELLSDMKMLNLQKRKCTVLGNGTWAPQSDRIMRELLSGMKEMDVSDCSVVIKSRLSDAQEEELCAVAKDIAARISGEA